MESGRSKAGQQRDSGQHVHPMLGWTKEGREGRQSCREEQPCKEEFSLESPVTEGWVEQGEMLHIQDGVLQKSVEDVATQHTWLLVNPFSL